MPKRRLIALQTALCFLVALFGMPSGPTLVCRFTGQPMVAVSGTGAEAHSPCCDVSALSSADGKTRFTLTHPGCCDLHPGVDHASPTAAQATKSSLPIAALTPAPGAASTPQIVAAKPESAPPLLEEPRPPPSVRAASPRGPPVLS